MTLTEKFLQLTISQRKTISTITNEQDLNTFLNVQGISMTNEEKGQILAYFDKGKLPLDDDDLDAVAGGADKPSAGNCPKCNSINTYMSNEEQRNKCKDCGHEWR